MSRKIKEYTPDGTPIYEYDDEGRRGWTAPDYGDENAHKAIEAHIEKHIGPIATVWHEIISDLVHLDVYVVKPRPERNVYTLITMGMSNLPMNVPDHPNLPDPDRWRFAEVMICLPPDWPMGENFSMMDDDAAYWPIHMLKFIARFPHEYETWIHNGHTIPNGPNSDPFAPGTRLGCVMLAPPQTTGEEFHRLTLDDGREISFLGLILLYPEEIDLKLRDYDAFMEKLDAASPTEILDMTRPSFA